MYFQSSRFSPLDPRPNPPESLHCLSQTVLVRLLKFKISSIQERNFLLNRVEKHCNLRLNQSRNDRHILIEYFYSNLCSSCRCKNYKNDNNGPCLIDDSKWKLTISSSMTITIVKEDQTYEWWLDLAPQHFVLKFYHSLCNSSSSYIRPKIKKLALFNSYHVTFRYVRKGNSKWPGNRQINEQGFLVEYV